MDSYLQYSLKMNETKRTELSEPSLEKIEVSHESPEPSVHEAEEEQKISDDLDIDSISTNPLHNVSEMSSPEQITEFLNPLSNPLVPSEGPSGQNKDKDKDKFKKEREDTNGHSKVHKDKKKKNKKEKKKHKHKSKHKHKDKDRHHSDRRSHDRTSSGGSTNASPVKH